jgi:hypothetical protein
MRFRSTPPGIGGERLLEALSGRGESPWHTEDPDAARFHLYEAVGEVLRSLGAGQPALFVIDDIHLADASSLQLLAHVAGELSRLPILILATMRTEPGELERVHGARPWASSRRSAAWSG